MATTTTQNNQPAGADAAVPAEAPRLVLPTVAPDLFRAYRGIETAMRASGIDPVLYELIKIRASQINGCAYCLDMHTQDARAAGETNARIDLVGAWREAPYYTARERAALALTEAVTSVADTHVPDSVWDAAAAVFAEDELAAVLMAIVAINGWNRLQIATRAPAGTYSTSDRAN